MSMQHSQRPLRPGGFTLLETLIACVIATIVTLAGIPELRAAIDNQRVKSATIDLYMSMVYARSEALKRNATIVVIPTSGAWVNGWTVQVASNGTVLRKHTALSHIAVAGPAAGVSYVSNGRLFNGSQRFELAAGERVSLRCMTVGTSGRPHIASNSCS